MSINPTSRSGQSIVPASPQGSVVVSASSSSAPRGLTRKSAKDLERRLARGQADLIVAMANEQAQLLLAVAHDRGRATLTREAVSTVAELSAMEENFTKIVPLSIARTGQLIDAYTIGATRTIIEY